MAKKKNGATEEQPERTEPIVVGGFEDAQEDDFLSTRKPDISLNVIGDAVTGYYCGARHVMVQGRVQALHRFILSDDTEVDVWGSKALDPRLAEVRPGLLVRCTLTAFEASGKKNDTKIFDVAIHPRYKPCPSARLALARATMGSQVDPSTGEVGSGETWAGLPQ